MRGSEPRQGDPLLNDQTKQTTIAMNLKHLTLIALTVLTLSPFRSPAGPPTPPPAPAPAPAKTEVDAYAAGQVTVSPFASYRTHEFGRYNGKFGAGLALSYSATRNLSIELETLGERFDSDDWIQSLTEAGANFKFYVPLKHGFAPYALLGYTRNLDEDQNRMNAGAGLEWRVSRHLAAFADGRWTHDFRDVGHVLFRLGGSIRF